MQQQQLHYVTNYVLNSGKKKAHKHKSFWPVTPPVTGESPDREARVKVLCAILGTQGT